MSSPASSSPASPDPLFRAVEFLRAAPEPGWDDMAGGVISAIRATAFAGGRAIAAQTPAGNPGPGRIYVSDHVLRSTLAIVLRQRYLAAPTRITFDVDASTDTLTAVLIELTGSYGTPLADLASQIRATTVEVIGELLGDAPNDAAPIDVTITDVVTGDPLNA